MRTIKPTFSTVGLRSCKDVSPARFEAEFRLQLFVLPMLSVRLKIPLTIKCCHEVLLQGMMTSCHCLSDPLILRLLEDLIPQFGHPVTKIAFYLLKLQRISIKKEAIFCEN